MANPVWPASLPQDVLVEGYDEAMPDLALRTEMDAGPAKVRRRFTAGVRTFKVGSAMTRAQVATLDTFFVTTVQGGALSFDWTHPRTQAAATFRFTRPPRTAPEAGGQRWRVELELEIMP